MPSTIHRIITNAEPAAARFLAHYSGGTRDSSRDSLNIRGLARRPRRQCPDGMRRPVTGCVEHNHSTAAPRIRSGVPIGCQCRAHVCRPSHICAASNAQT